jgi:hypothetical protein
MILSEKSATFRDHALTEYPCQVLEGRVDNAHGQKVLVCRPHIISIGAGDAASLPYQPHQVTVRQAASILGVLAVDYVGEGLDSTAVAKAHRESTLDINGRDLLALTQILDCRLGLDSLDAECDTVATPAAIKAQHETGALRRPAMDVGENTQRAVIAIELRVASLHESKARPPHERTVSEHPEIVVRDGHGRATALILPALPARA